MASSYPSQMLSSSTHLQSSSRMALLTIGSSNLKFRGYSCQRTVYGCNPSYQLNSIFREKIPKIMCAMNASASSGRSDDHRKLNLDRIMDKAREFWDRCPQPVKNFPWNRTMENFIQLIVDLVLSVIRYLYLPLLAVSSLSEMSYCAHEKKLFLIFFPLLIGFVTAGVLQETALELSPLRKEAEVPWHLITIAIFFTLLKLPGPYYPYWGRIFIPHFANGALLRTLWYIFLWHKRPMKTTKTAVQQSLRNDADSEPKKT